MNNVVCFLPFFFLSLFSSAQNEGSTYRSFILSPHRNIVWQKVYESDVQTPELIAYLKASGVFLEIISEDQQSLSGNVVSFENDFRGAGFSRFNTPSYISSYRTSGTVTYQFKEGRYRVTFSQIRFTKNFSDPLAAMGSVDELYDYAAKGRKNVVFREMFKGDASLILDHTFTKRFEVNTKTLSLSDDW